MQVLRDIIVLIKSGGDIATGVAHKLYRSHLKVCLTEIANPQAVRRGVAFSEAVYSGEKEVEGVVAKLITSPDLITATWAEGKIPLLVDPQAKVKDILKPDVVVDAILAKKNLGTTKSDALLVIGLGPGFTAGEDVHVVIETKRGHNLGCVILQGQAEKNTGIPGEINGASIERVLRAPQAGHLSLLGKNIGDMVQTGEVVALVGGVPVKALVGGIIRGLLRDGVEVPQGMKLGDIDHRGNRNYCYTISDKARTIAGGALEAILNHFNS